MLCRGLKIFLVISMMPTSFTEGAIHPTESMENSMTCEEFGRTARFNPYSVLDETWFVFYNWGAPATRRFQFLYPTSKEKEYIRSKLVNVTIPVNWTARMVLMKDVQTKLSTLVVENGDNGKFLVYAFQVVLKKDQGLAPAEVRIKQTCENRFIGYMDCEHQQVLAMSRLSQIPKKARIKDAAAAIGYRGRGGLSYLYQGHQWMPIDEEDEEEYWLHPEVHKRRMKMIHKYVDDHPDENAKPKPASDFFPKHVYVKKG